MNAQIDVTDIRIETPRLILRAWKESDLSDLYAYASEPGVGEMAGWSHHESLEDSQKILRLFMEGKKTFALELKETGTVIGSLGIEYLDPDPAENEKYGRQIGYVLGKAHWGRGLMTEAVKAVIDYCFYTLNYDFLTCGHFVQNSRSRRVVEKCGFIYYRDSVFHTQYGTEEESRDYVICKPSK